MKKLICFIIVFWFCGINVSAIGFESKKQLVVGDTYFDTATGHRYVKNSETTYAEYSKKGKCLRTDVPNTQPHLAKSRYIIEMDNESYLVYEKYLSGGIVQQILPASSKHPEGWRCKQVMSLSAEGYEKPSQKE
jgi:hypothetical protein